ncbi:MAG: hypothetical protein HC884_08715 [Chloroflexaceae bacterium]|nr:hypothetical protein [Chloroflexaceae bacterium]
MATEALRLSVEELALILNHLGQPEAGRGILTAQLGADLTQEEVHARLMASSHALMARGWLEIDSEGKITIDPNLVRATRIITRPAFSLRYSYSTPEVEVLTTYHFGEGTIFEHFLEMGLVHNLVELSSQEEVIQRGIDFFQLALTPDFTCSDATVSNDVMNSVKDAKDQGTVLRKLQQAGIPEDTRLLLAEDIRTSLYRGSILRIEYGADNAPQSNRGLLVLRGSQRLWLLRPVSRKETNLVHILPGTEHRFRQEVAELLK